VIKYDAFEKRWQALKWAGFTLFFFLYASGLAAWNFNATTLNASEVDADTQFLSDNIQSFFQVDQWAYVFHHGPFQAATENAPHPFEPEEQESEEDAKDNNFGKAFEAFLAGSASANSAYLNACSHYAAQFVEKRKVSLVILHHCWKSFLS